MFNNFCVQIIANNTTEHSISVTILINDYFEYNNSSIYEYDKNPTSNARADDRDREYKEIEKVIANNNRHRL